MRRRVLGVPPLCAAAIALAGMSLVATTAPLGAQAVRPRGVAVLTPDTIRVGEPFGLGVSVRADTAPQFPAILALPEPIEQLSSPEVARIGAGQWRAIYRLTGWQVGTHDLPAVVLRGVPGADSLPVRPPPVTVVATLPAGDGPLGLRPPRMPDWVRGFPWWWLLAALVAAALAEGVRRWLAARRRPDEREDAPSPVDEARDALAALKARALAGDLGAAACYDALERVLRRYLGRTRDWPDGMPVLADRVVGEGEAGPGPPGLEPVAERSLPVRFGGLAAGAGRLLEDIAVVSAWLDEAETQRAAADEPDGGEEAPADRGGAP
ncbi:MAG: hypothetical protein RRA92_08445 [Gemmatimonadota bacterium]|nr:hypothetical protein [Gemmatimonadota bacterium]